MRYFAYLDTNGKTLFFESAQAERKGFVGIFELTNEQTQYYRYNGIGVEKDNILYEQYVRNNVGEFKKRLTEIILEKYNHSIARLKSAYPSEEVTGWDYKSMQSKLWLDSDDKQGLIDSNSVLMLQNESDGTIQGITNLANRIINNSNTYQTIYGKNTRKYKELLAILNTYSTIQELVEFEGQIIYD